MFHATLILAGQKQAVARQLEPRIANRRVPDLTESSLADEVGTCTAGLGLYVHCQLVSAEDQVARGWRAPSVSRSAWTQHVQDT